MPRNIRWDKSWPKEAKGFSAPTYLALNSLHTFTNYFNRENTHPSKLVLLLSLIDEEAEAQLT